MPEDLPPEFKKVKKVGVTVSLNEKNLQRLKDHLKNYHDNEKVSTMFDFWLQRWSEHVNEYEKETDERKERIRKKEQENQKKIQGEKENGKN